MYKTLDEMTFHLSISFSFLGGFYIIIILTVRMFINKSNTVFCNQMVPVGTENGGRKRRLSVTHQKRDPIRCKVLHNV